MEFDNLRKRVPRSLFTNFFILLGFQPNTENNATTILYAETYWIKETLQVNFGR